MRIVVDYISSLLTWGVGLITRAPFNICESVFFFPVFSIWLFVSDLWILEEF